MPGLTRLTTEHGSEACPIRLAPAVQTVNTHPGTRRRDYSGAGSGGKDDNILTVN
jgi:hypothetical protein